MPGKCSFNARWLENEQYCSWLTRTSDVHKARCKICLKDFDIGCMGEPALRSHVYSKHHKSLVGMSTHTTAVSDFLPHTSTANTTAQCSASNPGNQDADVGSETTTTGQNSASTPGDRE